MSIDSDIRQDIRALYALTHALEQRFPGRKFTPDGHLLGSIGEVLAADKYGLTLLDPSYPVHDATTADGRYVQIKITQTDRIAISGEPNHLIALHIGPDGDWHTVYNGPGEPVWANVGKQQKNGQCPITLSKLRKLMETVRPEDTLPARDNT